jgi:hypothetical protein
MRRSSSIPISGRREASVLPHTSDRATHRATLRAVGPEIHDPACPRRARPVERRLPAFPHLLDEQPQREHLHHLALPHDREPNESGLGAADRGAEAIDLADRAEQQVGLVEGFEKQRDEVVA